MHPKSSSIEECLDQNSRLISDTASWLGYVGQKLMKMGNPDVQDTAPEESQSTKGPAHARPELLELVDVPLPEVTSSWSWQPRLSLQEEANFRPDLVISERDPEGCVMVDDSYEDMHSQAQGEGTVSSSTGASSLHRSHTWRSCCSLVFCWRCGAYTTLVSGKVPLNPKTKLLEPCKGDDHKLQGKLHRLRKGHQPQSGKYLGPVTAFNCDKDVPGGKMNQNPTLAV